MPRSPTDDRIPWNPGAVIRKFRGQESDTADCTDEGDCADHIPIRAIRSIRASRGTLPRYCTVICTTGEVPVRFLTSVAVARSAYVPARTAGHVIV